jgi:hypothetical protein
MIIHTITSNTIIRITRMTIMTTAITITAIRTITTTTRPLGATRTRRSPKN